MVRSAERASRTTHAIHNEKGPVHRCTGPVSVFSSARNQALMVVVSTFTPGPMVDESEMRLM